MKGRDRRRVAISAIAITVIVGGSAPLPKQASALDTYMRRFPGSGASAEQIERGVLLSASAVDAAIDMMNDGQLPRAADLVPIFHTMHIMLRQDASTVGQTAGLYVSLLRLKGGPGILSRVFRLMGSEGQAVKNELDCLASGEPAPGSHEKAPEECRR